MTEPTQAWSTPRQLVRSIVAIIARRPELGTAGAFLLVWLLFALLVPERFLTLRAAAAYLGLAAQIGILTLAVMLLLRRGVFDLSVGGLIGFCGMGAAVLAVAFRLPLWAAALLALVAALVVGFLNGWLVVRTGQPSFLVTLATLFILRGSTAAAIGLVAGRSLIDGLGDVPGYRVVGLLFGSDLTIAGVSFPIAIAWWLILLVPAALLLRRPGGDKGDAGAWSAGLFLLTPLAAWLVAMFQVGTVGSVDISLGEQQAFVAIVAAALGGARLTGGGGSLLGAVLGALLVAIVRQGLAFAGADAAWFQLFLGAALVAVILGNYFMRGISTAGKV